MAYYSMISYYDPKVEAWTIPEAFLGADEESVKSFVQKLSRTMRAGMVAPENDGFQCFRVAVFDDDSCKFTVFEHPQHLIDLVVNKDVPEVKA